jgi:serine/threonine protein kinase
VCRQEGWALLRSDYQRGLVWVLRCLLEIVFGMEYLHSMSIVHGDLKCANVLCKCSISDARGFTCKARPLRDSLALEAFKTTGIQTWYALHAGRVSLGDLQIAPVISYQPG